LPDNPLAVDSLILESNIFGEWVDTNTPPLDEINNFSADDIARIFRVEPTTIDLANEAGEWVLQLEEARAMAKQAWGVGALVIAVTGKVLNQAELRSRQSSCFPFHTGDSGS
jgi:hypothetical protein